MPSPFDHLKLDPQLACEFLGVFARYEYALKAAGFIPGNANKIKADWDRYAKLIDAAFTQITSPALTEAVDYLLHYPPKKQILNNGKIEWRDVPPNANDPRTQQVLAMVRRVRNNLFHGGKFGPRGDDRDQLLVHHSLTVLRECLPLDSETRQAFEN